MLPSLNYDSKDPKYSLLSKIFKIIDYKKFRDTCSRKGIKNRQMMIDSMKILFIGMFFDYTVSDVVNELNRSIKLRKFAGFSDEIPTAEQIYEYMSRYSAKQYCQIVNTALMRINKQNRRTYNRFIADATPSACDFNNDKHFIPKEHLEKLNLKWSFSTTKGHYVGFKVTVVLNEKTMAPVSILIHSGAPNDSKIFDEVLQDLQKRRIIKRKDIILFNRGYYAYKNYQIGINKYKIVPTIFPKSSYREEKLKGQMSYPMEVFLKNKKAEELKKDIDSIASLLYEKLRNWEELKSIRGIIEDFFKVAKDAFGLGEFHSYTVESMSRKIYLCLLLTALIVQQGYKTKTQLQRLAEGNVIQDTPVSKKTNKKKDKTKKDKKSKAPLKTGQQTLETNTKEEQLTLLKFCSI